MKLSQDNVCKLITATTRRIKRRVAELEEDRRNLAAMRRTLALFAGAKAEETDGGNEPAELYTERDAALESSGLEPALVEMAWRNGGEIASRRAREALMDAGLLPDNAAASSSVLYRTLQESDHFERARTGVYRLTPAAAVRTGTTPAEQAGADDEPAADAEPTTDAGTETQERAGKRRRTRKETDGDGDAQPDEPADTHGPHG